MPRTARLLAEDLVFHIMTRGNNRHTIFHDYQDYKQYLFLLGLYKEDHGFLLFHYCLMPNHVHIILKNTKDTNLPKFMKQINLSYMKYYKKKYTYDGYFWQGRYKSLIISSDEYLLMCGKYIELNPVRAKLVDDPSKYEYSSYSFYAYGTNNRLLDQNPIYEDMGKTPKERQAYYRNFVIEPNTINLKHKFIGPIHFIKALEERFCVLNDNRRRGRPKIAE